MSAPFEKPYIPWVFLVMLLAPLWFVIGIMEIGFHALNVDHWCAFELNEKLERDRGQSRSAP